MKRRIILLELNEITWDLIDPLIQQGKLPTFARLKREGTWGAPVSVDLPPQLDPWITWTTLHTGRTQEEHNVYFLEQPPETIHAKRMWEICADFGLGVGVYGSLCSWPPKPVNGFYVPDTFAKDPSTYPEELRPIQALNLTYTRSIRIPACEDTLGFKIRLGLKLWKLGLGASVLPVAAQLFRERVTPESRWRRVALQPLVNFEFFRRLYRKYLPDFATFHSNHVAHYQHTYWKAMDPEKFRPLEVAKQERRAYGRAIEHGYQVADRLLAKFLSLLDENTVLVVASSMGQKPFLTDLAGGKQIQQIRSLPKLLELLGLQGDARALSTMCDEFVIYFSDPERRRQAAASVRAAYIETPGRPLFHVAELETALRCNLQAYPADSTPPQARVCFPLAPGTPSLPYGELIHSTGHTKSGCHDPRGMVMFYGAGIRPGVQLREYNNLDFAPTFLEILGLPRQPGMRGNVMEEVVAAAPAAAAVRTATVGSTG